MDKKKLFKYSHICSELSSKLAEFLPKYPSMTLFFSNILPLSPIWHANMKFYDNTNIFVCKYLLTFYNL